MAAAIASTRPVNPPMRAELDVSARWVMTWPRSDRSRARRPLSQSCLHLRSTSRRGGR
ncbi:hypothetical protein HNP11_001624 [Tsukamurella ocularis]|nr:hypothetical protein [Tsukamurella ocularis]MCS3787451.1 hypothetical protein [Tsukamurella ocularis]MCS3851612.1 hypothetical protein [Tsukamurella ocularis]